MFFLESGTYDNLDLINLRAHRNELLPSVGQQEIIPSPDPILMSVKSTAELSYLIGEVSEEDRGNSSDIGFRA